MDTQVQRPEQFTALEIRVTELLMRLGIPACSLGYNYLRFAIIHTYENPEDSIYVTKTLYPMVARKCGAVSTSSVERTCHHAIEKGYHGGYRNEFINRFGIGSAKCPTCSEFIRASAQYLREKHGKDYL